MQPIVNLPDSPANDDTYPAKSPPYNGLSFVLRFRRLEDDRSLF
jgi:hypothetical protein